MSHSVTLTSLSELAAALGLDPVQEDATGSDVEQPPVPFAANDAVPDLSTLLGQLETVSGSLAAIARRDQEARAIALQDLERYDEIVAKRHEAEQTCERARQLRREAEALAERAYAEEARTEAKRIAQIAVQAEVAAIDAVNHWQVQAEQLAAQLDLERLLEERRRQQETEKAQAAEAERARRLAGVLAGARRALQAGRFEEAKGLLGPLAKENPDNPELASLRTIIAQHELSVKIAAAEETLWEARRAYRHDPAAAVARLEGLDVDGLPEPLARQIFGEWARACSRLCREVGIAEPLRYAPEPGRGAVIAREQDSGRYVVVSALGMGAGWRPGDPVGERQVQRARPLR